ncbi:MAG: alpha/beta fold hydrolase [Mycoplasma sp.]
MESKINYNINLNDIEVDVSLVNAHPEKAFKSKGSVIYLPGFGCDFYNHESFKDLLQTYDYYAINFPAHGETKWKTAEELTINHFAQIVIEFINKFELEDVVLIGHSSSAAIAALVNNLLPGVIKANVLISPLEGTFQSDAAEVVDVIIPRLPEQFKQLQRLKVFNWDFKSEFSPAWEEYQSLKLEYFNKNAEPLSIILGYLLSNELKASIEELYTTIQIPTLIVLGDSDGMIRGAEVAETMQRLIPHSELSIIPISGHEPALDNPKNYFTNVINFLDKTFDINN